MAGMSYTSTLLGRASLWWCSTFTLSLLWYTTLLSSAANTPPAIGASKLANLQKSLPQDCCPFPLAKISVGEGLSKVNRLSKLPMGEDQNHHTLLCCASLLLHKASNPSTMSHDHNIAHILVAAGAIVAQSYELAGQIDKANEVYDNVKEIMGQQAIQVINWEYLGPFPTGKTELDADPLETPMDGGVPIEVDHQIDWNLLVPSLQAVEVTEHQGWVGGDFFLSQSGLCIIRCQSIHSVRVDHGRPVAMDLYNTGELAHPVMLERGAHTISAHVRAQMRTKFGCMVDYISNDASQVVIEVHKPRFMPDLVNGVLFSDLVPVPTFNGGIRSFIKLVKVDLKDKDDIVKAVEIVKDHNAPHQQGPLIAPGQTTALNLRLIPTNKQVASATTAGTPNHKVGLRFTFAVVDEEGKAGQSSTITQDLDLELRYRELKQSFIFTFLDHDGTISHAGLIAPQDADLATTPKVPVVLTLHGTGIAALAQADSYKIMPNKATEYKFGVKGTWVCAPDRHGAHNWEHTGHRAALSALEALGQAKAAIALLKVPEADADRVIYAGHSMGGHGAAHLASHAPDKGLGLAAGSAWLNKESYGDSNSFFKLDLSIAHTSPRLKMILESTIAENNLETHAANIKGLQVKVRTGDIDRTVAPWFARRFYRQLKEQGVNVSLSEVSGKEHWWWDTKTPNDGGTNNDKEMRLFFNTTRSIAHPQLPSNFSFVLYNPSTFQGRGGLVVVQQHLPFHRSTVDVTGSDSNDWHLEAANVRRLGYHPSPGLVLPPTIKFHIGGKAFDSKDVKELDLCMDTPTSKWALCDKAFPTIQLGGSDPPVVFREKHPTTYGPVREVNSRAVWVLVGSQGGKEFTEAWWHAGLYMANLHYIAADTVIRLFYDHQVKVQDAIDAGVNVILLGDPTHNSFYHELMAGPSGSSKTCAGPMIQLLPSVSVIPASSDVPSFQVGPCTYKEPGQGALFTLPWNEAWSSSTTTSSPPLSDRLLLAFVANSPIGVSALVRLAVPTIPPMTRAPLSNLIPDYVVVGEEVHSLGYGGLEGAGFWNNQWEWSSELTFIREETCSVRTLAR